MKVTIELTDGILHAIAYMNAEDKAYDLSEDARDDMNFMYATAFEDGAKFILNQLNQSKQ